MEFVSRAIASDDNWQVEFDRLYEFLDSNCHIKVTKGCSTHVHVSPSAKPRGQGQGQDDKWTYSDLRSIMKAISYYDDPITKVMPADRKQNPFAKSNMKVEPPSKYYPDVSTKSWKPLFKYYDDALPKDISTRRAHATMGGDRRVSWNFEHITENCGTIEFRRCPGCDTADEAKRWVIFTLGFLCQARANGKDIDWGVNWCVYQDLKKHPSVKDLGFFVNNGAERLWDPANRRALGRIVEDTSKATVFPAEEIRKMKQLEDGKSPFAESVSLGRPQSMLVPFQACVMGFTYTDSMILRTHRSAGRRPALLWLAALLIAPLTAALVLHQPALVSRQAALALRRPAPQRKGPAALRRTTVL